MRVNIIDTPGHVDFTAEVERSLRVLDGAIAVFCAVAGVQPQSETVWRQANKYNVPRIALHQQDGPHRRELRQCVEDMRKKLGANAWPILIPIGTEDYLKGQIDVVNQKAIIYVDDDTMGSTYTVEEIPAELKDHGRRKPTTISSARLPISMTKIGMLFLEEKPITHRRSQSRHPPRRPSRTSLFRSPAVPLSRTRACSICSTRSSIISRARSTSRRPRAWTPTIRKLRWKLPADDNGKFCSLAFKLWSDPFVGKLVFFRVYSRQAEQGRHRLQSAHQQARAHLPPDPDSGGQARGYRYLLLRRHRRDRRHQERHHRRHAVRRGFRDPARAAVLP